MVESAPLKGGGLRRDPNRNGSVMHKWAMGTAFVLAAVLAAGCGTSQQTGSDDPPGRPRGEGSADEGATRGVVREGAGPRRWALLIGVNDYAELEDLKYCSRDMQALAEALAGVGFPADQVFLLHDEAADRRNQHLQANIEAQLCLVQ